MEKTSTRQSGIGRPYPKYLILPEARNLIAEIEAAGGTVEITAPAPGSASVQIAAADGNTHAEIGRPEELEELIRTVARECGLNLT